MIRGEQGGLGIGRSEAEEVGDLAEDKAGVGVARESGLDRLQVEEGRGG